MLNWIMIHYGDLAVFVIAMAVGIWLTHRWLRRSVHSSGFSYAAWSLFVIVTLTSCILAVIAGSREARRLTELVSGLAPTYASELARLGYGQITIDTAPDDPVYLGLIDAELRWLRLNPAVADIYTFGLLDDGTTVVLVDSETDYNRDGKIEGDRESRTKIGEVYEDDAVYVRRVLAGESIFFDVPETDRWGTWVNTYEPIRDESGKVIGVLGVDYAADEWVHSILLTRAAVLGMCGLMSAVVISSLAMTTAIRAEHARRKIAESALRTSEARLRTIVDNEPECVMVVDPSGTLLEINPAGLSIVEATAEQVLGKPVFPLIHPDHREHFRQHHVDVCGGKPDMREFEFVGLHGTSRRVWMEIHSVPLRGADGQIVSVLSVARDVSARKQSEAEREHLQRQLLDVSRRAGMAEIATGVLHNVGNVLNSVNVSVDIIAGKLREAHIDGLAQALAMIRGHRQDLPKFLTDDAVGRKVPDYLELSGRCIESVHKAVDQELASLTKNVDHIKQIVRSQQETAKASSTLALPVRPQSIVDEAVKVNAVAIQCCGAELVRDFDSDLGELALDKHKILQVLVNLISNAEQAVRQCPPGQRRIHLSVHCDESRNVSFEVRDNGVGIAPENLPRVFQHGFTTRKDGHGFGLHSAANSATEMGGTLTAHSDGPGRGACFRLTVPIRKPDTVEAEAA